MESHRIEYIDLAKFVAIYSVVLGHLIQNTKIENFDVSLLNSVWSIILSFHMPLFAFLSGMFLNINRDCHTFITSKVKALALPYIVWLTYEYIIKRFVSDLLSGSPIYFMAIARNMWFATTDWGFWFIRALFFCYLFAFFFNKAFYLKYNLFISILFLYTLSFLGIIPNKNHMLMGFIFLYPFFISGFYIKKYINLLEKKESFFLILSFVLWVLCLCFWKGLPDSFYGMNTSVLITRNYTSEICGVSVIIKTFFRYIIGMLGSLFVLLTCKKLHASFNQSYIINKMADIGSYTIVVYIISNKISDLFDLLIWKVDFAYFAVFEETLLYLVAKAFLIVLLCYMIGKLSMKINGLGIFLWGKNK